MARKVVAVLNGLVGLRGHGVGEGRTIPYDLSTAVNSFALRAALEQGLGYRLSMKSLGINTFLHFAQVDEPKQQMKRCSLGLDSVVATAKQKA
jgi:hypothetical protein